MGQFSVIIEVSNLKGTSSTEVEALVGTGARLTQLPMRILRNLGISVERRERFKSPNGRFISRGIGIALIGVAGHHNPNIVVFTPENATPLLGWIDLQALGFEADTEKEELVPKPLRA